MCRGVVMVWLSRLRRVEWQTRGGMMLVTCCLRPREHMVVGTEQGVARFWVDTKFLPHLVTEVVQLDVVTDMVDHD